ILICLDFAGLVYPFCVVSAFHFFFFKDPPTTQIYTLSLHDALPIYLSTSLAGAGAGAHLGRAAFPGAAAAHGHDRCWLQRRRSRSEEHTSELQSLAYLVCRLLLEKKKSHSRRSTRSSSPPP